MAYFFPSLVERPVSDSFCKKEDCAWFLKKVAENRSAVKPWKLRTEKLVPLLRPYQEDAVRFMISREVDPSVEQLFNPISVLVPTHPSFTFYPATGGMSLKPVDPFKIYPGGILADEMGLGKTVEFIALALTHQRGSSVFLETKKSIKPDIIKIILDELVSTVVAGLETQHLPLKKGRKRSLCLYDITESENTKRSRKGLPSDDGSLLNTVTCTSCNRVCKKESVFWDKFPSDSVEFHCPECISSNEELVQLRTSLIIAPSTICRQWYEELKRHVRADIKVDLYRGVAVDGYKHPAYLACQHFVICSFETLRSEIHFTDVARKNRGNITKFLSLAGTLRKKTALYAPSPLISVEWWRVINNFTRSVCLDEAQVVEGVTCCAYQMCQKLAAVNRWCVTGTPIKNSVMSSGIKVADQWFISRNGCCIFVSFTQVYNFEDLFGFLNFIRVEPFCYRSWFDHVLWDSYIRGDPSMLIKLFSQILWRSTKADVVDQVKFPICFAVIILKLFQLFTPVRAKDLTVLHLSPFEEQLYRNLFTSRAREKIAGKLAEVSSFAGVSLDICLSDLHGALFDRVMEPLQNVRSFVVLPGLQFAKVKNDLSSKEQLQEELFKRTTTEIEKAQRDLMFYYNGIAGLHWLLGQYYDALSFYHCALESVDVLSNENVALNLSAVKGPYRKLRPDRLQLIHTLNGLLELKEQNKVSKDDFDKDLAKKRLKDLVDEHMVQATDLLKSAQQRNTSLLADNTEKWNSMHSSTGWLVCAANSATDSKIQATFVEAIKSALDVYSRVEIKVRDLNGLQYLAVQRWDELTNSFKTVKKLTEDFCSGLFSPGAMSKVEEVIDCHFVERNENRREDRCSLCMYDAELRRFESLLYFKTVKRKTLDELKEEENELEKSSNGEQSISTLELVIRIFRQTMMRRSDSFSKELLDFASETVLLMNLFKDFLKEAKKLMLAFYDYVARSDELRQCKIRISYTDDENIRYRSEANSFLCTPGSEKAQITCYEHLLASTKDKQLFLLSKLRYLNKLRHETAIDCPVCYERIQRTWLVFPCAHCICSSCYDGISRRRLRERIRCPVCRYEAHVCSITFVQSTSVSETHHYLDLSSVALKKEASVKLNAVVRRILSIGQREPAAKILLFTSLINIISFICKHLEANEIKFRNFAQANKEKALLEFCSNPDVQVLVIPTSCGARGLNLTVANHVIFVEPQLDATQLAQAIGRIDRIGQTRKMMVHHFVMFGTIEEQIYNNVLSPMSERWTVRSLLNLMCMCYFYYTLEYPE
ncbi:unnamed protein product [Enterobius vermicularis]|uniref:Helicase ATP-binding domain-containing protein n=1 Tax=Enterobius vermicularis TaxID=51028 RepID=A0A0N4VCI6_ENTVE|nr:unnamed protein product [Enterobius vermicularis]